ncbi:hypothetical protein H2198_005090 [Neophaeococcomyces mojaviensis]|uniref:Uncharacterized protein n=1 Tax=Neophaeococcomyces mojaviensis TaxID=3383035 RepID=A0ACC3A6N7_9EURO|nr:hypothetical protein H2198_005090 [Knufia sp. JES_112]
MAPKYIKRITLFKVPKEEDIDRLLAQYEVLRQTAVKDGKPYIISNEAGRTLNASEPRAQGYTICVQSTFASMEDVNYYDKECEAHKKLRALAGEVRTDFATMIFGSDLEPGKL